MSDNVLGRELSPEESAFASSARVESLSLPAHFIELLSARGVRTAHDLAVTSPESLMLGPRQFPQARRALLLSLAANYSPKRLEIGGLAELPERVEEVLAYLVDRRRTIIKRVHGLWDGIFLAPKRIPRILDADYLTVRRDIGRATADLRTILRPESDGFKHALQSIYVELLAERHGMACCDEWKNIRGSFYKGRKTPGLAFVFLCRVTGTNPGSLVIKSSEHVHYDSISTKYHHDRAIDLTKTALLKLGRSVPLEELRRRIKQNDSLAASPGFMRRCFAFSKEIGVEKSGAIGLRRWSYFDAHNLHEMAHAALAFMGKPTHHAEIASMVDKLYPHRAPVNRNSIQTALTIHSDVFVLARHGGIFGLKKWRARAASSLKDFLISFMREKGGWATRQDLLAAAKAKGYKASSVSTILNMNKKLFKKVKRGLWEVDV